MDRRTQQKHVMAVQIPAGDFVLDGDLTVPANPAGIVIFAHGSGSSRHSARNRFVAQRLQAAHMATLLLDLLTPEEERVDSVTAHLRFDIDMLADRLLHARTWSQQEPATRSFEIGYFGASTGAAAALIAAAREPEQIDAVVSRGGRPDLAGRYLPSVKAPTLLIVGSHDHQVMELNEQALAQLTCEKSLEIVPGATHLFEEPGTLEQAAAFAAEWFSVHIGSTISGRTR